MDSSTPVVILNCELGGLAILRSLAPFGVECWGVDKHAGCAGFLSRYCQGRRVIGRYDDRDPRPYLDLVLDLGRKLGRRAILIPTADDLVLFTVRFREELSRYFDYPCNTVEVVERLISKLEMAGFAEPYGVPVAKTALPSNEAELLALEPQFGYPVLLKPCFSNRPLRGDTQTMVIVDNRDDLIREYRARETFESPNMMLQEYIPGGDDQIYIFNGYFDANSRCVAGFTGRKIRQHPIHRGCASLGEQCSSEAVMQHMIQFLGAIGYRGVVDAGLRYDARDGRYKLLDVNPRVGQAFRLFLARDGTDVVQAMYRDLTGQAVGELVQREGRRWAIEDMDLVSFFGYRKEGSLGFRQWLASYRGVEETAWWSWRDPRPFAVMSARLASRAVRYLGKQVWGGTAESSSAPAAADAPSGKLTI